jgi:hypothetical protein
VRHSIPFNAEADSLNCAILAPDVTPDDEEFELFVKEVAREMTVKAGQKCTAIRRAIVPRQHLDAVAERCAARLAKVVVGDPSVEGVKMGALASHAQQADVAERVALLRQARKWSMAAAPALPCRWARARRTAPSSRPRCCWRATRWQHAVHDVEAFGPVSTLMPYDGMDEALHLAARWARAAWWHPGHQEPRKPRRHGAGAGRAARPPARAGPRIRARVHRPRLAAAGAQARRPGPRRRRRGAGRPARRHPPTCSARRCRARPPC